MSEPINLDPIDPTVITPGLAAIPLTPTPWDNAEDGQYAATPNGIMFQRRKGLWHMDPWWQSDDGPQIITICAEPDQWAYDLGWTRKQIEDAHGPLTPVALPNAYPHNDEQCRQNSVDAHGFTSACRHVSALLAARGVAEVTGGLEEAIDWLIAQGGQEPT